MTREEVIEYLKCIRETIRTANATTFISASKKVLYMHYIENAIELLKAQEPIAPIFDYDGRDVWRCGNCHRNIFHPTRTDEDENEKNYRRFCFHCGRRVKWG